MALRFAAPDAEAITKAFEEKSRPLFRATLRHQALSAKEVWLQIRDYFQSLFRFTLGGDETPGLAALTAREQEILNYVSKGFLDKEIAGALSISIWTVHNHLKHIYEKLDVHNRTEAVLKYLQK